MKKVDIIIPIYNAYEFTKKCIETILENTDLKENNLVLINDQSPDIRILPMLKKFQSDNKNLNIIILENEENCGFVKTVNKGMNYSDNDIILLNSDTEVTKNWLNKLRDVAYIEDDVATVTPLSNNATLASIPNFLEENKIPAYITLEEYAKDIEECSFNSFPELTTAHGYCMYIKREAIEKVGFFDDETFGKGYGEENDFSYRCIQYGFKNLLCDNTFIYHKGTQSFTESKKELIDSHIKILQEKYKKNWDRNTSLCMNNPHSYIQDNIKYYVGNKHRNNILIIVHEFLKKENKLLGGTVLHIYDVIEKLREKMNFHVLFPENGTYRLRSFFESSTSEIMLGEISNFGEVNLYNHEYKELIKKVFSIVNVDFIHVHHIMNHYFDLFDLIEERKIPYMISLHDFYFVCPVFSLLENNEKYCGDNPNCDCKKCLKNVKNIGGEILLYWRNLSYKVLSNAEQLVVPSNSTKEIFEKYYKNLDIKVIEHGFDPVKYDKKIAENKTVGSDELDSTDIEIMNENRTEERKINIAFMGGINKFKGIDFLEKFIEEVNKEDSKYKLHLFGATCEGKLNKSKGNYIYHGKYNRDDSSKLLNKNGIDLVLLLAIWPETYSYLLTEVAIAGVPVLALDYGALGERIPKDNLGWILDRDSNFEDVLKKLDSIFEDEEDYLNKKESINKYVEKLKSVKEMSEEYEKIYKMFLKKKNEMNEKIDKEYLKSLLKFTPRIVRNEEKIDSLLHEIEEYHKMVMEYRKEIARLGTVIGQLQQTEEKYNHLISSRKLNLLKKIGFIEFE